jgi:MFS transporter, PHS family, inorganic phosphate transporter
LSKLFISSITFLIRRKYLTERVETCALSCRPTDLHVTRYWGGLQHHKPHYPPLLRGLVNAASNIGNIIGQLTFGFLGDALGRRFVYGKELIVCIIGTILVISLPNSIPTPTLKMVWISCFRVLMGVGIGGDYPMSASIVSERSHLKNRGQLLAWIFSNQGWVSLGHLRI